MLIKSLKGLVAASVLGLLGMVTGCSAPCGASGRLCAPVQANTSALAGVPLAAPAAPASASHPSPVPPRPPASSTSTRIGLLLPLQSAALGAPSAAIRDGFLAGHERDQAGFTVTVIATGDAPQEVLKAYVGALATSDIVVGPLARSAVAAVAASGAVNKPTVALNNSATAVALPPQMVSIGLSVEDEARQVAAWAAAEHPHGLALVLAGTATWQGRIATAFHARWRQLGLTAQTMALSFPGGYLDPAQVTELKTRIGTDPPDLLFAALDAAQLRQVRAALANPLPCYGTSSVNPGSQPGKTQAEELNGVRLVDLPWEIQPQHPSVMVYPRPVADDLPLDLDRLYALGIDAFRVAREIALHPGAEVTLDGVTGQLKVGAGGFERVEAAAVYRDGGFDPVATGH